MPVNQLNLTVKCDLSELARVAGEIEEFGALHSWPVPMIFNVNLALDELITNIVNYGFPNDEQKKDIQLTLTEQGHELRIILEDEGVPFDPFTEADQPSIGDSLEDRVIGGLGVFFVKSLVDAASYERREIMNRVTLLLYSNK